MKILEVEILEHKHRKYNFWQKQCHEGFEVSGLKFEVRFNQANSYFDAPGKIMSTNLFTMLLFQIE